MSTHSEARTLPDALRAAAIRSVDLLPKINAGEASDPLRTLIPGDADASVEILHAVSVVTGNFRHRKPPLGEAVNTAPASRAQLRRWAVKEGRA